MDCRCDPKHSPCLRRYQIDWVIANNLPCRPLSDEEIERKKRERVSIFLQKATWNIFYYAMLSILLTVAAAIAFALAFGA